MFENRVIEAFRKIVKDAKQEGYASILIVTHGGPLRSLSPIGCRKTIK